MQDGVNVRFKYGSELVGNRTTKSRLDEVCLTKAQYADDAVVYATLHDAFQGCSQRGAQGAFVPRIYHRFTNSYHRTLL